MIHIAEQKLWLWHSTLLVFIIWLVEYFAIIMWVSSHSYVKFARAMQTSACIGEVLHRSIPFNKWKLWHSWCICYASFRCRYDLSCLWFVIWGHHPCWCGCSRCNIPPWVIFGQVLLLVSWLLLLCWGAHLDWLVQCKVLQWGWHIMVGTWWCQCARVCLLWVWWQERQHYHGVFVPFVFGCTVTSIRDGWENLDWKFGHDVALDW